MSLRTRITGLLILLSGIVICSSFAVQAWVIFPAFAKLEKSRAETNVERCVEALGAELETIANLTFDWSAWDENYEYVQGKNPAFKEGNLKPASFNNTHMNLICVVNREQEILWGETRDFETLALIEVPDLFLTIANPKSGLTGFTDLDQKVSGLLQTSNGPILLASCPIITTDQKGPVQGWVIMGRFLNETLIGQLSQRTHCDLSVWQLSSPSMPQVEREISQSEDSGNHPFLRIVGPDQLDGYYLCNDIHSQPAIMLKVALDREIMKHGNISAYLATLFHLLGGLVVLLGIWFFLSGQIVKPLQQLATHAKKVGVEDDLTARLDLGRSDEIGFLAKQLDQMVEKLADSRKRELSHAHRAGMAETAAEVLHNIGNAVNSANCCVENLNQSLLNSKLSGLGKGIALLKQASHSPRVFFEQDPRAPKLVEYLTQLNNSLEQEQSEKGQELSRLQGTIRHIRDVISAQNHLQFESEFLQETKISELLDELRMIIEPKLEKKRVDLNINVESDDSLLLNRNRMVQVLLNLAKNAIESMSGPDCENRALKIRVQSDPEATHFEITDTGKGFDESIRNRLFSQGFTTRQGGSGLGLHYCANAIHQAGGSISALSDGPGKGATFRIRLPHQHRGEPQAKNGADLNGASAHGS